MPYQKKVSVLRAITADNRTLQNRSRIAQPWPQLDTDLVECKPAHRVYAFCVAVRPLRDDMDPLSQGAIGATIPLATRARGQERLACAAGFVAGLAADLDVLIRSSTDSLLYLEFHRQFTHSLIFIPFGGLVVAALLYVVLRRWGNPKFLTLWIFCALGYATHGLLDTATSYGTQLLWPFSDTRFAASIISIIDPLFTGPMLVLVTISVIQRKVILARVALVWSLLYLGVCAYQNAAAEAVAGQLAKNRGHVPVRLEVKPTFGNLIVWKSIYEAQGRYYVDAIRPNFGETVFTGSSIAKLNLQRDLPWLDSASQQATDVHRFAHFSDQFVAKAENVDERIIDVRYSLLPNKVDPLWSIRLSKDAPPSAHAKFETHRSNTRENLATLLSMIFH